MLSDCSVWGPAPSLSFKSGRLTSDSQRTAAWSPSCSLAVEAAVVLARLVRSAEGESHQAESQKVRVWGGVGGGVTGHFKATVLLQTDCLLTKGTCNSGIRHLDDIIKHLHAYQHHWAPAYLWSRLDSCSSGSRRRFLHFDTTDFHHRTRLLRTDQGSVVHQHSQCAMECGTMWPLPVQPVPSSLHV